ncbi:polyphenol oxidase family protein [Streptacidiphilus fuscans]|uniref:Laccase domain-containing protein n=1 Tax=Streptacidiphilus fuscans TaxID=2789292 RepID=A0A931B4H7_9ACTN|nr:polyphenol oxidase family protein [Streptacidiphilus fuscans]MBF9070979.1 laccase domain-containing protein [Streptacidiphilus fuscans]
MIGQRIDLGHGVRVGFSDRWGGVSPEPYAELNLGGAVGDDPAAVRENRRLAAHALGIDPADVVWMNQVHGAEGFIATGRQPDGEAPSVDAVATARPGLALAVLTADCTPILLADTEAGVLGAAHVGRPGLAKGVADTVVALMRDLGAERIEAVVGPSICGRCYEVPDALRAEVAAGTPEAYAETSWGTPALDIPAGVRAQLARQEVTVREVPHLCTLESEDHFSYRRASRTGRLASYIWLEGEAQ